MSSASATKPQATSASWSALGSTATVHVADPAALAQACAIVLAELEAIDLACSRFRADSELERVNAAAPRPVAVSELLLEAVEVGLRAAHNTDGDVDPALGMALLLAGYDRDFELLEHSDEPLERPLSVDPTRLAINVQRVPGWHTIVVDREHSTVALERGVRLDLGATAKALAADRAAAAVSAATGVGALVNLGGDLSVAGEPPRGGWQVFVTDDHRNTLAAAGQLIEIVIGGIATSSVTRRRWWKDGAVHHHIIDPRTGTPASSCWRTVSVAAASCVDANIASTAALVRGEAALAWLTELELPARLVSIDGLVHTVAGWPAERTKQEPTR
jgi:thiamine biosynthesis lipoprotein ApbE